MKKTKVQPKKVESKKKAPAQKPAKPAAASSSKGRTRVATESAPVEEPTVLQPPAEVHPAPVEPPAVSTTAAAETAAPTSASTQAASSAPISEPASSTAPATADRDPRLPPAGTVLQKKNRKGEVRCECVVTEEGFVYQGVVHRSLSAAAVAAGKDLGLTGALNGFAFWGLSKPRTGGAPRKGRDPVKSLEKAFSRYRVRLNALLSDDTPEEARARLVVAVKEQADVLLRVGGRAAS